MSEKRKTIIYQNEKNLDNHEYVIGLFLDLSKAFDCVDHEILLQKLYNLGIRGVALKLIKSYLNGRKQYVAIKTNNGVIFSDYLINDIGIPQGSILGPLFFIIYVHDLIIFNESIFMVQYADDTSFAVSHKDKETLIQCTNELIDEVNLWFEENKLKLNAGKTNILHFQLSAISRPLGNDITCDDIPLDIKSSASLLGLTIDDRLKFDTHIESLCTKLSRAVFALRCLKRKVDEGTLKQCYYAYFQSILAYGIEIWGHVHNYLFYRVFKLQKQALRIIAGVPARTSCRDLFKEHSILSLPSLYASQLLIFQKNTQNI